MSSSTGRASALRGWRLQVAGRRLFRQGRLLLLVLSVAVLASTAVTSVGLLITATEQSGIRTALAAVPATQTGMSVFVQSPKVSLAAATSKVDAAIRSVLGHAGTATHTTRAFSAVYPTPTGADSSSLAYFGELAGASGHVIVSEGSLPTSTPGASATIIDIAVPKAAATALHLGLGTTIQYASGARPVTLKVIGIFSIRAPQSEYWSQDPLMGIGNTSSYISPTDEAATPTEAFGPMLVAPGSLDAIGVLADRLELDYTPIFRQVDAAQLDSLIARVSNADSDVPSDAGAIAQQVSYTGDAEVPLEQIASALVVTQSTVVVVTLLLLVLSIAALGQAARLFNDARSGDRELMRARGASGSQLLGIALLEAAVVGVVTAVVSAPLARIVYIVIAAQPALTQAHVPRDSGLPGSAWLTSVALGVLFVTVLIVSLLGRSNTFVAAEQTRSRGRRISGVLRSGLDLGVVVIAGVAFWQLSIYRSPVGATTTMTVDPVLVAAPALVLLAGSLLAARIFPLIARLVDAWGNRTSSVILRLSSWEIGRRSGRATAVVLLLTLALAVGTFSQTFLATWRQSQVDQAGYAVGPPVRVPAVQSEGGAERSSLTTGAIGQPQPVLRRIADVAQDGADGEDTNAVVLGLTPTARALLDRGQLASEGGSVVASRLKGSAAAARGITLPGDPDGIAAVVRVGDATAPLAGVGSDIRVILQDGAGLLSTVDLGDVPLDGQEHSVSGTLAPVPSGTQRALPIQVVGIQASVDLLNQATYVANAPGQTDLLVGQLASVTNAGGGNETNRFAKATAPVRWSAATGDDGETPGTPTAVAGWQIGLRISVPADVQKNPGDYSVTAWPSVDQLPAVMSSSLAHTLDAKVGTVLVLSFATASVPVYVVAITPLIPASVDGTLLTPSAAAGAASANSGAVVVDQAALERALVQGGETGSLVDEWWVNVAPGTAAAYLKAHPAASGSSPARSSEVLALQMQQDPLRVATQAALWLAIAAAALLAAIGFAVHSASTLAARRIELAQLRAIGLSRRRLVALIGAESLLLCVIGIVFGVAVGLLLGYLAGPLIALSPNGMPAVPPVRVIVPWLELVLLMLVVVVVLLAVVAAVARGQRSANPADILREADNG